MGPAMLIARFHQAYYAAAEDGGTWKATYWQGVPVHKSPLDLWVYSELIYALKPAAIVETGTLYGGSALYFASLCDLLGQGHVITVDRERRRGLPSHPRITYVRGDTADAHAQARVSALVMEHAAPEDEVLVSLDGAHDYAGVTAELNAFARHVTPGSYLVVEDTNLNGHPVEPDHGPGPAEALADWLPLHPEFEVDRSCERHLFSFHAGGWLRRKV